MKVLFCFLLLFLFAIAHSQGNLAFNEAQLNTIINSEKHYSEYLLEYKNYSLASIYLDDKDSIVQPVYFFEQIYKKSFFPLRAKNLDKFKLFAVETWPNKQIREWVTGDAYLHYRTYSLIGKKFITSELQDIDGLKIDSNSIKDKTVFVKVWFIACAPCVDEMPMLNKIVRKNKKNNQLLFISLAFDSSHALKRFLTTREFAYKTIPVPKSYIFHTLGIISFPTHFVVKNNEIVAVLKSHEIEGYINQLK